jgi:hypothetical protein
LFMILSLVAMRRKNSRKLFLKKESVLVKISVTEGYNFINLRISSKNRVHEGATRRGVFMNLRTLLFERVLNS